MTRTQITPVVTIDPDSYNTMSYWAFLGGQRGQEITCFALTSIKDGKIHVGQCYLIAQEGSAGGVDGDDDSIMQLIMKLDSEGIDVKNLNCWVHSHPGQGQGATYLSGTDEENIKRWLNSDFMVSIVFDSKGDSPYTRIDIKNPRISIDAKLEVGILDSEKLLIAYNEFQEKVKKRTYQVVGFDSQRSSNYPGYQGNGYQGTVYHASHKGTGGSGSKYEARRENGGQKNEQSEVAKIGEKENGTKSVSTRSRKSRSRGGYEIGSMIGHGFDFDDDDDFELLANLAAGMSEGGEVEIEISDDTEEFEKDIAQLEKEIIQKIEAAALAISTGNKTDIEAVIDDLVKETNIPKEVLWDHIKTELLG